MGKDKPEVQSIVTANLNLNVDRDDVVAIKVADFETKLMSFELQTREKIEGFNKKVSAAQKKIYEICQKEAEDRYLDKAKKLANALAAFEDIDADKYKVTVKACSDWRHCDKEDRKKKDLEVSVNIAIDADRERYNHEYSASRKFDAPKAVYSLLDEITEHEKDIKALTDELTKARCALAQMSRLERRCRAELAKVRLKETGNESILSALESISLPGMPKLEAPK